MVEPISRHDPCDIAWVAGIIDGEGYVGLMKQSFKKETGNYLLCPSISMTNTDYALLRRYTEILHKWDVHFHYMLQKRKKHYKAQVCVRVTRFNSAARLLEIVLDHLTAKKPFAEIVLEFCCWKQSLRLNSRKRLRDENGHVLPGPIRTGAEIAKEHEFFERLEAAKQEWIDVSQTTRRGSQPIEIKV